MITVLPDQCSVIYAVVKSVLSTTRRPALLGEALSRRIGFERPAGPVHAAAVLALTKDSDIDDGAQDLDLRHCKLGLPCEHCKCGAKQTQHRFLSSLSGRFPICGCAWAV